MKPIVSIIMPTYNRGHTIIQSIHSVQRQSFREWELVIVDDGSQDETNRIVEGIANSDKRIRYVAMKKNSGVSAARNRGMRESKGKYIAYLDSDNYMYTDWLSCMISYFNNNPRTSWLYPRLNTTILDAVESGNVRVLAEEIIPIEACSVKDLWSMKFQADPNGLVHKQALVNKGGLSWDLIIDSYGDYEYALQLSQLDPKGFAIHPFVLGRYIRIYGTGGMCSNRGYKEILSGLLHLKAKYCNFSDWTKYTDIDDRIMRYTECLEQGISPIEGLRRKFGKTTNDN